MTNTANQRTHATEGTQAHNDAANKRANVKYWTHCEGMDREDAKRKVDAPDYIMKSDAEINRAIKQEAARQENLRKREERRKEEEAAETKRQDAAKRQWEADAKRAEEDAAKKTEEPKTEGTRKSPIRQGGMKVSCNGVDFTTLVAAMCSTGKYDMKETKLRSSHWNKIRKVIQRGETCLYDGDEYSMI